MAHEASLTAAVLLLAALPAHADTKYTLPELKAAVAQGAFAEAYRHLDDVDPTARTADWIDVAAQASAGWLGAVGKTEAILLIDTIDREHPQVLKSAKYTRPRAELGVASLAACFDDGSDPCFDLATRFVDRASDPALLLKVAKVARVGTGPRSLTLFARTGTAACKDDDLKLAVLAGLGLPPKDDLVAPAKQLMLACWDALKDPIVDAFGKAGAGGAFHKNTCPQLKAKQLLSPLQVKVCARP